MLSRTRKDKTPDNWHEFRESLELESCSQIHPDFQGEKQNLFSGASYESTEIEYLDVLHSLILAIKPQHVLETGTNIGLSAAAIAYGFKYNSDYGAEDGCLYTIDIDPQVSAIAKQRLSDRGVGRFVKFFVGDSISVIQNARWKEPFELVFFDSTRRIRPKEYWVLKERQLLASGALLVFHDTCKCKIKNDTGDSVVQSRYVEQVGRIAKQLGGSCELRLSRGLTICQFTTKE